MNMQRSLLLIAIAAAGCGGYTAPDEVVYGTGVYTQPQPGFNFAPLNGNYFLDSSMDVWKDGVQQAPTAIPTAVETNIVNNMTAYGYTRVGAGALVPPANAETGLRLAWIQNTYAYYYNWCSGYWYGWYGCWPTWGYAGSYSTGTVLMMMVDLRNGPAPNPPPSGSGERTALWASALYSVLYGNNPDTSAGQSKWNSAIDQAFAQSPYLKTN